MIWGCKIIRIYDLMIRLNQYVEGEGLISKNVFIVFAISNWVSDIKSYLNLYVDVLNLQRGFCIAKSRYEVEVLKISDIQNYLYTKML